MRTFNELNSSLEEQTAEAPSLKKHRIGVRVTNPNNKREVKYVVVTHSSNKKGAQAVGEKHFKKKGYFVHGSFHSGMVSEEVEIDEAMDFKKEAAKHMKDMHDKNATPANKAYAQKMLQRALEASKMKDKVAATKHYMGEDTKNEENEMLSFKHFQVALEEAKKKSCKESELENAHGKEDEDDELEGKELEEAINEVLSKDASAGEWIRDFVHSDNPKFEGKSKEKRKQMALAAYYAKQRNEEIELEEGSSKVWAVTGTWTHRKYQKEPITTTTRVNAKSPEEAMDKYKSHMSQKYERKVHKMKVKPHTNQASTATRIEHVEIDESAVTHIVAKKDLQKHKDWMDSEGFDTNTKPLPKSHPKHSTHVGIVSKNSQESSYHEEGHASPIKEEVEEIDEADNLALRGLHTANPQSIPSYMRSTEKGKKSLADKNAPVLKSLIKSQLGKHPKANLPEEVEELDELSKKTLGSYVKAAAKDAEEAGQAQEYHGHKMDYERGEKRQKGIGKAVDRLTKEEVEELDEVSPFDWKAYAKERGTLSGEKTKTFHNVKKTSTGTVYTKQVNPDGTSKGSGDDAAKAAEKAEAPKRGRGRPKGVGAKAGSYKPRDPAKKAASAAKAAATKAANRAMRKESFDEEFMSSLIEGFEEEDFQDFLQCEEFDSLDEATREALLNFINEKSCGSYKMKESLTGKQHKLDKNKNGKLDSQDFKLLRKEETEQIQESVTKYAAFLSKKN